MQVSKEQKNFDYIYKKYDELYHNVAVKLKISDTALMIYYELYSNDKTYTQNELAEKLYISKQTINSAVSKLVLEGTVELTKRENSRNSKTLALTDAGKKLCKELVEPIFKAENDAFEKMTKEEREKFFELYEKHYLCLKQTIGELLK